MSFVHIFSSRYKHATLALGDVKLTNNFRKNKMLYRRVMNLLHHICLIVDRIVNSLDMFYIFSVTFPLEAIFIREGF